MTKQAGAFLDSVRVLSPSCIVIARAPGMMVRMWCGHMLYLGPADSQATGKSSQRGSVPLGSYSLTLDRLIYSVHGGWERKK